MKVMDRLAAGCGAAAIVLLTVGSDVLGTPPGPQIAHPTGQQVLDHMNWVANTTSAQVGVGLELLGFVLMIVFFSYLSTRVRDAGWLATAALAGGLIEVAIKLGSGAPMFAAYTAPRRDQPGDRPCADRHERGCVRDQLATPGAVHGLRGRGLPEGGCAGPRAGLGWGCGGHHHGDHDRGDRL